MSSWDWWIYQDVDDAKFFAGVSAELEAKAGAEWQQLLLSNPNWVDTREKTNLEDEYVNAS